MPKYTAILEQADDGNWSAYTAIPTSLIIGSGNTQEAAIKDLQTSIAFWLESMKEPGQKVPVSGIKVVTVKVPS